MSDWFLFVSGEVHSVPGSGYSYTLAANVALLTRNIKIVGEKYPDMMKQSFGARVLVSSYTYAGVDYKGTKHCCFFMCRRNKVICVSDKHRNYFFCKGKAQIHNVEFDHTGQEGWTDYYDARYSLTFYRLGQVLN